MGMLYLCTLKTKIDMKRFSVILTLFAGFAISVSAQDIITTKDGTDIKAKILEVTINEVKYKKFNNLEGPTFTMLKSEILIVRYQNGENEVFKESRGSAAAFNTDKEVYPGMRYRDYKDFYNTSEYVSRPGDPYTPFWIGFGDFFIPGLGNAITGEWGRAAGFFFGNLALGMLALSQVDYDYYYGDYEYGSLYWVIMAARLGLNIASICDAVHVAKAKNMYNQDLRAQHASLDFRIEPYLAYTPTGLPGNSLTPAAGLSLKLSF